MTRLEIVRFYKVRDGRIEAPGKFEGEAVYAPYFYAASLDSYGEELSYMEDGCGEYAVLLKVDKEDRIVWPEIGATTAYILLRESSQGFVSCEELTAKRADRIRAGYEAEAEAREQEDSENGDS